MRKLLCMLALGLAGLGAAPATAGAGWSAFEPIRRAHDRTYIFFVPDEPVRSGRFAQWDDGYFQHGGGVDAWGGRATFDYDRDYPYEFRSASLGAWEEEPRPMREPSCTIEHVRDREGGWTDVRVCRN